MTLTLNPDQARALAEIETACEPGHRISTSRLNRVDVAAALQAVCRGYGGQRRFAARAGVSDAFVSAILHGEKDPSDRVLEVLGIRRVVTVHYERVIEEAPHAA